MSGFRPPGRGSWRPDVDHDDRRWGLFWIGIWTFFLLEPLSTAWSHRGTVAGWVGIVSTLAFAVWYVGVFGYHRRGHLMASFSLPMRRALPAVLIAVALAVVDAAAIGQDASACAVYICVLCVMIMPLPYSLVLAMLNAAAYYAAGYVVPGWNPDNGLLLSMMAASVAVWGVTQMLQGNFQLRLANDENQRLAVSEERNRFARDLHDILGHSLTVITVKAELAKKLMDVDTDRARSELADLERLSRDALADVRRAVEGYRELTLPGELARARTALAAAEIEAELPNSTDDVPSEKRELFAWTIREGVTNVIRHSGASRCTIVLHPDGVEIRDDGRGLECDQEAGGHGLVGLRERASAVGATVITKVLEPGFSLQVSAR